MENIFGGRRKESNISTVSTEESQTRPLNIPVHHKFIIIK